MKTKQLFNYFTFILLSLLLQFSPLLAQSSTEDNGMATLMYQSGKIYVVIGVILLIFIGIVLYLVALDRKIKKMEDEM